MADWYVPTPPRLSGAVGVPTFLGAVAQEVPDPSPGVNSVLWGVGGAPGTFGPTPPPEDRWPVPAKH